MSITIATDGMIRFFEAESEIVVECPMKATIRRELKVTGNANREPKVTGCVRVVRLTAKVVKCDP